MKKQTLISTIIALVVLLCIGLMVTKRFKPELFDSKTSTDSTLSEVFSGSTSTPNTDAVFSSDVANITTIPVENGKYLGVVELGASGFNSFVIEIDKSNHWKMVKKEYGKSLAIEGFATKEKILQGLEEYISSIFNTGVNGKNIHFVVSSGAVKNPNTEKIVSALKSLNYTVNVVTPEQEGQLALKALLPSNYYDNSFVVDIGSGNTKISWYENGVIKSLEGVGAKYKQNGITDAEAYSQIEKIASAVPESKRQFCFIIGGVPYDLAKLNKVDSRYQYLRNPSDYDLSEDKVKERSGLNIYKAIKDATKTKDFIFDWDANFSVGLLIDLNKTSK